MLWVILIIFTLVLIYVKKRTVLNVNQINHMQLNLLLKENAKETHFLDVRSVEEFKQKSLKGFKNIPLHLLPLKLDELSKDSPIVLICASGARSMQAARFLSQNGFQKLYNVQGGIMAATMKVS